MPEPTDWNEGQDCKCISNLELWSTDKYRSETLYDVLCSRDEFAGMGWRGCQIIRRSDVSPTAVTLSIGSMDRLLNCSIA